MPTLSSEALSRTLLSLTETKIDEVTKKLTVFSAQKTSILKAVEEETNQGEKVRLLLDGLKTLRNNASSVNSYDRVSELSGVSTQNIRRFLDQSRYDPSISPSKLNAWESLLRLDIDIQGVRYEYASLFGWLVSEWLSESKTNSTSSAYTNPEGEGLSKSNQNSTLASVHPGNEWLSKSKTSTTSYTSADPEGGSFIEIGRKEMYEQREIWESYAFTPVETDVVEIESYLSKLFTSREECKQELMSLREYVKTVGADLMTRAVQFNNIVLQWCIKGLLSSDLLSDEKRSILMEFSINETVLTEVADVLNLRMAALDKWNWDPRGLPGELRRKLNGKYRVFLDEDILDALLLQYIGVKWGVGFKVGFQRVLRSEAWSKQSSTKPMTRSDRKRREYFLESEKKPPPYGYIQYQRWNTYQNDYFMTLLPSTETQSSSGYDVTDGSSFRCPKRARVLKNVSRWSDSANQVTPDDSLKSAAEVKQSLLHLLSTESLFHTHLHGHFTIIQSDFKWFGPSLPHSTIFAVLRFFGVSEQWIMFFKRFLEAPVKFVQDGPEVDPKLRRRGTPISHALSEVFGEVVLFCMDFAVNQETDGSLLYRLHDDIWFWGQEEKCVNAWKAMTEFAQVMGISFNEEKTGSVRIMKKNQEDMEVNHPMGSLPEGEIRWGFLKLDPVTGLFVVNQTLVDIHTAELQVQLSACNSVFAWVQAWNKYLANFFVFNFCKPAHCFGRQHVDMIIQTFRSIYHCLFAGSNVTEYLRKIFKERFEVEDIPDGFFYFPVEMGGLGLHNPFISLFAMRESILTDPSSRISSALRFDEKIYQQQKKSFLMGRTSKMIKRTFVTTLPGAFVPDDPETFMGLEEYLAFGEETSEALSSEYSYLLSVPEEVDVQESPEVISALVNVPSNDDRNGISGQWQLMTSYYKWVVQLYGTEMIHKFGGLRIVDEGHLPIGIVHMLQQKKMKWKG